MPVTIAPLVSSNFLSKVLADLADPAISLEQQQDESWVLVAPDIEISSNGGANWATPTGVLTYSSDNRMVELLDTLCVALSNVMVRTPTESLDLRGVTVRCDVVFCGQQIALQ